MKQTMSPPPSGHPRAWYPPLLAMLVLLTGLCGPAKLSAQSPVSTIEPGNLFHLRLTKYGVEAVSSKQGQLVQEGFELDLGVELLYEKVGEAGRGTRYLVGWRNAIDNQSEETVGIQSSYYNTSRQHFKVGIGKSQAAQYKRLVLRGGVDAYLSFSPGARTKSYVEDSTRIQDDAIYGRPSARIALRPFVGLGLQVSKRLAIGIEYGTDIGLNTSFGSTRYTYSGAFNSENKVSQTTIGLFVDSPGFLPFIHLSFRL